MRFSFAFLSTVVMVQLLVPLSARAETLPFIEMHRASLSGGMEACRSGTIRKAQISAVRKTAEHLNGKHSATIENVAQKAADCCVQRVRVIEEPRDRGTGECQATVKVWVDTLKVAAAMKRSRGKAIAQRSLIHVGAVIRYMIDGKLADPKQGFNPQEAVSQYQSDLFDLNLRMVNLSVFHDEFDTRRFGVTCAISKIGHRDCSTFMGYARTVQEVLRRTRMAVEDKFPDVRLFRKSGGWVAIGEVSIARAGRDPEGVRHCALATVNARLFRLETGEIIPAGLVHKEVCAGTRPQTAVRAVLIQAVGESAEKIAENLTKRVRDQR